MVTISIQGWAVGDEPHSWMHYWAYRRWSNYTLGDMLADFAPPTNRLHPELSLNDLETRDTNRMILLAVNIIMLLGSVPEEISPEKLLRKGEVNKEGEMLAPELWSPSFIGRPTFGPTKKANANPTPSGVQHAGEVRRAHWKRQAHGPGHSQRKTIWVSLYRTRSLKE